MENLRRRLQTALFWQDANRKYRHKKRPVEVIQPAFFDHPLKESLVRND